MTSKPLAGCTIAFDLDGTLVDSAPDLIGTLNAILGQEGHPPLPLENAREMIGRGAKALLRRGFEAAGAPLEDSRIDELFDVFIDIYLGRIADESRPFDGLEAALDAMEADGAVFAVCTNKRTDLSLALLDRLGLTARFKAVVGADAAPKMKPDASHLVAAVEQAGGRIERALMVGDSASDANAGKAAGTPVVLVTFGYTETPVTELHNDAIIDHYDQLPAVVARLLAVG